MATLYLIRHSNARGNGQIILGQKNVPLTPRGHEESKQLAENWKIKPHAILSSPLLRAMQTAEPLAAKYGLPIISELMLIEGRCGDYEGRNIRELQKSMPELFFHLDGNPTGYMKEVPGVGNWEGLVKRASGMLRIVSKAFTGKKITAVTHQGLIYAAICAYWGKEAPEVFRHGIANGEWRRFDL